MQSRTGYLLNTRQRPGLDLAKQAEVDDRNRRQRPAAAWRRHTLRSGGRASRSARRQKLFNERFDVVVSDATLKSTALHLRQIDAQFAREPPYGWASVGSREAGFVDQW
jgi:hypothetical protein